MAKTPATAKAKTAPKVLVPKYFFIFLLQWSHFPVIEALHAAALDA
jgi:hypothetical protein